MLSTSTVLSKRWISKHNTKGKNDRRRLPLTALPASTRPCHLYHSTTEKRSRFGWDVCDDTCAKHKRTRSFCQLGRKSVEPSTPAGRSDAADWLTHWLSRLSREFPRLVLAIPQADE